MLAPSDGFNDIARAIQLALAPVFLLTGIAGLLSVMAGRLARIFDRSSALIENRRALLLSVHTSLDREQDSLERRRRYTSLAITSSTIAALLVCLDIAVIFLELMFDTPMKWPIGILFIAAVLFLCFALAAPAYGQAAEPAAVAVGTVYAERKPIAKTSDFVGRIEAINRVEVRARVKGYLEAVLFKEGDRVKEGQPLYQIEKGLFEAAVEQAAGALERAKAALTLAELQRKRAEDLLAKASGTVMYSAYPPSASRPVASKSRHRFSFPSRQNAQRPQAR